MKVFSDKGKLEVVCYTIADLIREDEYNFCKVLYEYTEGIEFDNEIFKEAQDEVNKGCDYSITEDDPKNKIRSWIDCIRFFKKMISAKNLEKVGNVLIGFEYHLKKRWVDALIVCEDKIIILEFKSGKSDDDYQIKGYLKQLKRYTNIIRRCNKEVVNRINQGALILESYLVFTNPYMMNRVPKHPSIVVSDEFTKVIESIFSSCDISDFKLMLDGEKFLDPSISGALRTLIHDGIVSYVEKDNDNVKECSSIMHDVLNSNEPTLGITIVKGGPGTGKTGTAFTLLETCLSEGITNVQYVTGNANLEEYFNSIVDGEIERIKQNPSANPLFQELIQSGAFKNLEGLSGHLIGHIRELYNVSNYCNNFFFNKNEDFFRIKDQVLLVDEAQRMWNYSRIATRSKPVRGQYVQEFDFNTQCIIYRNRLSEAYLLLFSAIKSIESSNKSKNVVLFIGNGQEISNGEEDGETDILNSIYLLSKIKSRVRIKVFVSDESVRDTFVKYGVNCELHPKLKLKSNQRNDEGDPQLTVVNSILNGENSLPIKQKGYEVYNNYDDLLKSIGYEKNRSYDKDDESIGIVVDSYDCAPFDKDTYSFCGGNLSNAKNDLYQYYYHRNSNKLDSFVSEFECQGLEFDDTILIWGNTLLWESGHWKINHDKYEATSKKGKRYFRSRYLKLELHIETINKLAESIKGAKSLSADKIIEQFVKNAYRVLLTRARETTYIFVEDCNTYNHLKNLLEPVDTDKTTN